VVVAHGDIHQLVTKGAPEQIIQVSTCYGNDCTFTDALKQDIINEYKALSNEGFRVLAVAEKRIPPEKQTYTKDDESEMTFLGFIAFLDPPKESTADTLEKLEKYGIKIKVLTGDNEIITQKIARDIRLPVLGVLMGTDIEHMTDEQLQLKAEETTIFARVSPDQKQRIIRALRAHGHVVGYLGDGINDAPPLKAADVGISVENAVDVAKDTADLILLKKSLDDLVAGVVEGRRTFANTLNYLMMSLSSNFGNMFSMAGASALLPFLPMTAPQILLNNLLYDMSQFTIPSDTVDETYMMRPRVLDINFLKHFMIVFGSVSSIFDFATFYVLTHVFGFTGGLFQTGWFLESMATQTFVIYVIRTRKIPFIQSSPSAPLALTTLGAVVASWVIVYAPFSSLFGFTALSWEPVVFIIGITAMYLLAVEFVKHWFYRTFTDPVQI
jgi:Mg2+-importing ATPase